MSRDNAQDWRGRARCRHVDPELFFPVGTTEPAAAQTAHAQAVCRACPVLGDCLDFALRTGQQYGIWGGLTGEERRGLHRARRARGHTG